MKPKAKKKTKKKVVFPKVLYIEDGGDDGLYLYKTPEEVSGSFQNGYLAVTAGVYVLSHMARVTTEVKVTACGPSKAGK
jgi:hypothetical protein